MSQAYIRLAKGLKNQQSILIPKSENIFEQVKKNPKVDLYSSLFNYNQSHFDTFQKTKSVAGISGLTTNQLFFDFDSKSDIQLARTDSVELCNRLIESGIPDNKIRVYFSGSKGFHISVVTDQQFSRQEFINIVFNLASDLKTFDTRINDEARVLRVPLTRHHVTGLHKIPLSMEELATASIDEIKTFASDVSQYDAKDLLDDNFIVTPSAVILELKDKTFKKLAAEITTEDIKGFNTDDIDLSLCPKWLDPARFCLQEGFFWGSEHVAKGERNTAFLILAATYKNQGFSADHSLNLLLATAEKQAQRTNEAAYSEDQLRKEIIAAVFSPSWKGGIFGKDEELLVITRQRFGLDDEDDLTTSVEDIEQVGDGFKSFAKNLSRNRIFTGLQSLDDNLVLTAGMLVTVVAAPGAGKTAIANMFAETISKGNEDTLYFSLDLFRNLLFNRLLQRYVNYDMEKILEQFESGNVDEELMSAYTEVVNNYSNVGFRFKSTSIEDIDNEIKASTKQKGRSPKLVIVDYLDKVKSPYQDPTQSSAYVASQLSDMAKKYNCLVLLLAQPSKFGSSGPEAEFKSYRSIKGSSGIENDSRVILGLYRAGYNSADSSRDLYSSITILKNNAGRLARLDYGWNGLMGTLTELTAEQRRDLKRLREELEETTQSKKDYDI